MCFSTFPVFIVGLLCFPSLSTVTTIAPRKPPRCSVRRCFGDSRDTSLVYNPCAGTSEPGMGWQKSQQKLYDQ